MKKTLAVLLSICMLFCLVACGTNNTTIGDTTNDDVSQTETKNDLDTQAQEQEQIKNDLDTQAQEQEQIKNDFVVGETLDNLIELPLSFPYGKDTKVNVQEISITKSEILNPNEMGDYIYSGLSGYTFYRYKYSVTIKGNTDPQYAEKYIGIKMHVPNGSLTVNTYFEGTEPMSGGYNSTTNKTELGGCVFKIQNDGSFTGEFTGYSNDNLNEFMITSISNVHLPVPLMYIM